MKAHILIYGVLAAGALVYAVIGSWDMFSRAMVGLCMFAAGRRT